MHQTESKQHDHSHQTYSHQTHSDQTHSHEDDPTSGPKAWAYALALAGGRGPHARLAADRAGIGPGDHVVDVGCGTGTAVREAVKRGATAVGVDPSDPARRLARW